MTGQMTICLTGTCLRCTDRVRGDMTEGPMMIDDTGDCGNGSTRGMEDGGEETATMTETTDSTTGETTGYVQPPRRRAW